VEGGRWVVRALLEDAPATPAAAAVPTARHAVEAAPDPAATREILRARPREVREILGEAPLGPSGATLGVAAVGQPPDAPILAARAGAAVQLFPLHVGAVRAGVAEARWTAAFADVDGDGRTDVVLRMTGNRADGSPLAWTTAVLAPPPSVQAPAPRLDLP